MYEPVLPFRESSISQQDGRRVYPAKSSLQDVRCQLRDVSGTKETPAGFFDRKFTSPYLILAAI